MTDSILVLNEVHSNIEQHHILQGVTFNVTSGRPTVLLGRNGAGKSSVLRAIMGLNPITSGESFWPAPLCMGSNPMKSPV